MKIGDLAEATATPVETIRYYEREGLLPAPARSQGNFRLYEATHRDRLLFIRHCRNLDMSLDEVRTLLRYKDDPSADCGDVNALLDEHIGHVATRIRELRALEKQLRTLRETCSDPTCADRCGILANLSGASAPVASPASRGSHGRDTVHAGASAGARRRA